MADQIIGMHHWLASPTGQHLLRWEQACCDEMVANMFGYHAVQLGMPALAGLRMNRIPHQWLALGPEGLACTDQGDQGEHGFTRATAERPAAHFLTYPEALPFAAASLDLLVLPHTLELCTDPHQALREAERVLVPEGKVVITGFNPFSLWGWRQLRERVYERLGKGELYLPDVAELVAYGRLRDWLRLLGFDIEIVRHGCYGPAVSSAQWLERFGWMEQLGAKCWPQLGSAYLVVATKRVHGMRLLAPGWTQKKAPNAASVPVA